MQPRAEIKKLKGAFPCDFLVKDAICRANQKFAGYDKWAQAFIFEDGGLGMIALSATTTPDLFVQVIKTVQKNNFYPAVIKDGGNTKDLVKILADSDGDAVAKELDKAFSSFVDGSRDQSYFFVPLDMLKNKAGIFKSYQKLIENSPDSLRIVELEVKKQNLLLRFTAPKLSNKKISKKMDNEKF